MSVSNHVLVGFTWLICTTDYIGIYISKLIHPSAGTFTHLKANVAVRLERLFCDSSGSMFDPTVWHHKVTPSLCQKRCEMYFIKKKMKKNCRERLVIKKKLPENTDKIFLLLIQMTLGRIKQMEMKKGNKFI